MSVEGLANLTIGHKPPEDDDSLFTPPSVIYPDRSSFSQALDSATRKLSLAHTHETHQKYEAAYPLYLSSASAFLWAHRNLDRAGLQEERLAKFKDTLMRQTKKALERAESIKSIKGSDWAKRWAGSRRRTDVGESYQQRIHFRSTCFHRSQTRLLQESQTKILDVSSHINHLRFEPWLPHSSTASHPSPHPLPDISSKQASDGAHFRHTSETYPASQMKHSLWNDGEYPQGQSITQDAVTNCGLVAAMEVIAEHDRRWATHLLTTPFLSKDISHSYDVRLHFNGCPRHIRVDDQLPFLERSDVSPLRLMCACLRTQADQVILLPSFVEKAYLTILRSYAPPGSVPAEDLHVLTGWLPEVIDLRHHPSFQKEKTWQRIHRAWLKGWLLICAGTSSPSDASTSPSLAQGQEDQRRMTGGGPFGLVPAHSYAVLGLDSSPIRSLTLMNPWRLAAASAQTSTSTPFSMTWTDFCQHFATLHLAWSPKALFQHRQEVHASWPREVQTKLDSDADADSSPATRVRNVALTLKVTAAEEMQPQGDDRALAEGRDEVWLHLCRHLSTTSQDLEDLKRDKRFIAVHIFQNSSSTSSSPPSSHTAQQDVRIVPLSSSGSRSSIENGGVYVDSAHHLVRFKPQFQLSSLLRAEQPGLSTSNRLQSLTKEYDIVVSLHGAAVDDDDVNFTLRAWSGSHPIALEDTADDGASAWHTSIQGQWNQSTSGGHQMSSTFHHNPQYLLTVPPNSPSSTVVFSLIASPPSLPVHAYLVHSPYSQEGALAASTSGTRRRVDSIEKANVVADSGTYSYGLAKFKAQLPSTPPGVTARYHLILSTYEAGTTGSFTLQMASSDVNVVVGSRPPLVQSRPRQIQLQSIPIEGAGMYHKSFKAAWDVRDGTAAGAPRCGRYDDNPSWIIRVGGTEGSCSSSTVRCILRLVAKPRPASDVDNSDALPAINLSLFPGPPNAREETATTGPYASFPCGVALHDVRLQKGKEYVLVASTFQSGHQGQLELLAWSEARDWEMSRLR